ncbi:MAG TPA: DegQ family serine endoprotease [Steroidobacteraceae bacterium]|jgi:serine protease Do|nr:DegQ family serine endoprotease [Steroidobacteraceae bacterium]
MSARRLVHRSAGSPWALPIAFLAVAAAACAQTGDTGAAPQTAAPTQAPAQPSTTAQALPDFTGLVKQYGAAVVNVVSTRELKPAGPQISPEDPFYEFFRRFGIPVPGAPGGSAPQPRIERGEGSGFIVSSDGYVLTNAHVVNDSTDVTVKLTDRREFSAKVVGSDVRSDVAVLKIDARGLPTVKIGDSSKVQAGEWVVAIGAPFGFENSVTAGVVSATSRAVGTENSIVPFIQTDVAVNPGNSGGPLFNLRGEVIGINSMIYSGTGGYQGISFAIPIDIALDVEQQLIKTGHVTRGRIGVTIQEVTAQLAQSFGLDRPRGALVSSVEKDGPADKAGLKPGDVILAVNGRQIEVSSELANIIAHIRPGDTARLDILRNGKNEQVRVRVAELQEPRGQKSSGPGGGSAADEPRLGLNVRPLTPDERSEAKTEGGLLVESASGPAATAGVQPGDIILRVGTAPVNSVDDLRRATQRSKGTVALLIQRGNAQIYVPVPLG